MERYWNKGILTDMILDALYYPYSIYWILKYSINRFLGHLVIINSRLKSLYSQKLDPSTKVGPGVHEFH